MYVYITVLIYYLITGLPYLWLYYSICNYNLNYHYIPQSNYRETVTRYFCSSKVAPASHWTYPGPLKFANGTEKLNNTEHLLRTTQG